LTAAAVKKYAPQPGERRIIRDAGARSLFLVITPTGHKSWMMRFRAPGGRIGKLVLGPVDLSGRELKDDPQVGQPLSLSAARQLAASVLRQRSLGHDPVADHKARKLRQRAAVQEAASNTFRAAAQDFITKYSSQRVRRWKEQARLLGLQPTAEDLEVIPGGLAQRWANKPLTQIDGYDIHQLVAETRERGAPGLERRSVRSDRDAGSGDAHLPLPFVHVAGTAPPRGDESLCGSPPARGIEAPRPSAEQRRNRQILAGD
jgi:hypothetical protein